MSHGYQAQEVPAPAGDAKTTQIKRKPVAPPAPAYVSSKEAAVEADEQAIRHGRFGTLPQRHVVAGRKRWLYKLRTRWTLLQKRTRIIIIMVVCAIMALVIGLAAGIPLQRRSSNLPLPNNNGGPYSGVLTYYDPALGACGMTNKNGDKIVAVSHTIFDAVSVSSNPNANPLCGKKIRASRNGKSVDLTVVDRCTGCQPKDIDVTRSVFGNLASIDEGRVPVQWSWLDAVPAGAK